MATTYAAHIWDLGQPEIHIMTDSGTYGPQDLMDADIIATYPLPSFAAWPPPPDTPTPEDVLTSNGWHIVSGRKYVSIGHDVVTVEPGDIEQTLKHVTFARTQAEAAYTQQDTAWRTLIRDAMNDGGSATRLAAAASISRERVYQIRDGRR